MKFRLETSFAADAKQAEMVNADTRLITNLPSRSESWLGSIECRQGVLPGSPLRDGRRECLKGVCHSQGGLLFYVIRSIIYYLYFVFVYLLLDYNVIKIYIYIYIYIHIHIIIYLIYIYIYIYILHYF